MKVQIGIYQIQSKCKSERIYIGSSVNITKRWNYHLGNLKGNRHVNKRLQNHYNKYGKNDLMFSILIGCDQENLIANEQFFIDSYNPWFNLCKIASTTKGLKHTDECKKRMSEAKKGKPSTRIDFHHTEETKAIIREKRKNQIITESTKRKLSEFHKGNKWALGQKCSEEKKVRMSIRHKGKITSIETKNKMRDAALKNLKAKRIKDKIEGNKPKQKKYTFKRNAPSWNKGLKMSEESKAKLSASTKGRIPWNKGMNNKVADKIIEQINNSETSLCN